MEQRKHFVTPVTHRASWRYGHNYGTEHDRFKSSQDDRPGDPYPLVSLNSATFNRSDKGKHLNRYLHKNQENYTSEEPDELSSLDKSSEEKGGNHEDSLKHMLEDFGRETTAHGIVQITTAKSNVTRSMWLAIVLLAASVMLVQMTLVIIQYFEYNVNVKVTLVSEKALEFPSVTICNTNKLRKSAVRDSKYSEMLLLEQNFAPPYYTPCMEGDFLCQDGIHCIKPYLVCDGVNHCGDMSDEDKCNYPECGPNQFRCDSGSELGICLTNDKVCDRIKNCYGGEDETDCGECLEEEFQCLMSRECISNLKTCDNLFDCLDGSDESGIICEPEVRNVASHKHTWQSGRSYWESGSEKAVDGNDSTCAHSEEQYEPLWLVDLGKTYLVYEIRITHMPTWNPRLSGSEIKIGLDWHVTENPICYTGVEDHETQAESFTIKCTPSAIAGRYVSIQIKDKSEDMRLCEVDVMGIELKYWNLALDQKATQSSTFAYGSAVKAVDGDNSNNYNDRSCTQTQKEYQPWWKVDLGGEFEIYSVIVTNRADCCGDRLHGAVVRIGNSDVIVNNTQCGETITADTIDSNAAAEVGCVLRGRFVSIQLENKTDYLSLCEVEVIGEDIVEYLPNVALHKPAEQSSTYYTHVAGRAVDGDENPALESGLSCIHSANEKGAWWFVDLLQIYAVYEVVIINRYDCCSSRILGALIRIGYHREELTKNIQCGGQITDEDMWDKTITRDCIIPILGRYVIVQNDPERVDYLHFCEVKVYAKEFIPSESIDILKPRMFAMFEPQEEKALPVNSSDVFSNLPLDKCLSECLNWKRYECHSFDFHYDSKTCRIHRKKVGMDSLQVVHSPGTVHYQKLRMSAFIPSDNETECPIDYVRCTSGECVYPYQICDTIVDCVDGFDEFECANTESSNNRLFHFYPGWNAPFLSITDDIDVYKYFEENVYVHHDFDRVKGEDPPDWTRFRMFSKSPDLSELERVLKLSVGEISELGHQAEDFILQCTYAGEECDPKKDFTVSQDQRYGNCFHFNMDPKSTRQSTGTGPDQGLTLTLFTEQDEYLSIYGQDSAAVVGITPPGSQYFPEDQGFFALPGTVTSVSLSMGKLNRQKYPYGNCTNEMVDSGLEDRVASRYKSEQYTLASCEKACLQNALVVYCGCTDTLGIDAQQCLILNETQVVCKTLIYYLYQKDLLECNCPPPCSESKFFMTISQSQWPSHAYLKNLLKLVRANNPKTRILYDLETTRANLVRLRVYFETLNYDLTSELPAHTWEDLLSDIGGTLGLYVGFSVITVCEFMRLILGLCRRGCSKRQETRG
ncbi:uncharacterized protein [Ptychodera flava]|uniref:uncharacterized protein isoform X1 n=1 Tax=Ptychodera flava TaxID=63121 RepID=UPI00396A75CD